MEKLLIVGIVFYFFVICNIMLYYKQKSIHNKKPINWHNCLWVSFGWPFVGLYQCVFGYWLLLQDWLPILKIPPKPSEKKFNDPICPYCGLIGKSYRTQEQSDKLKNDLLNLKIP